MIESPTGIDNLPSLLAPGGVDAVLIGPHDLSISCGIPEQYDHPRFTEAMREIIRHCQAAQVGVGVHYVSGPTERYLEWQSWGFNLICHRSDTLYVARGIRDELGGLRAALEGDGATRDADRIGSSGHAF
jgi:2-keto-3-deoxy-L-rhamnonate aldolase RhmA